MTQPIVGTDGNAPQHRAGRDEVATANNFNIERVHVDSQFDDSLQTVSADEFHTNWEQYSAFEEDSSYDSDWGSTELYPVGLDPRPERPQSHRVGLARMAAP